MHIDHYRKHPCTNAGGYGYHCLSLYRQVIIRRAKLFEQILRQSHFLIAPTLFDCFGIVYCEASAYGIPVLTTDVGGVSQAVRNGQNGFLFAAAAPASDYADTIIELYTHKDRYANLGRECRKHFETRLNWSVWESA